MSPVITDKDFAVLLSQKLTDGSSIYLYPISRDIDIILSDESNGETLADLLENGVKPNFGSLKNIFADSDDIIFEFNSETGKVVAKHTNEIASGSATGSEGNLNYGDTIKIPRFVYDVNGHITEVGTTSVVLPNGYTLPKANETTLGGIIIGSGLVIDETGKVSVKAGNGSEAGILKLLTSTESDSVTEAATPKSVKDALAIAIARIEKEVQDIDTNGVTPNYADLANMFTGDADILFNTNEEDRTFSFTHKNKVTASSVSGSTGNVDYEGEIEIPTFEYDSNGHIIRSGSTKVILPKGYILPTASKTEKGGVLLGDTLVSDELTGEVNVVEGSKTVKGILQLETSTSSDSESTAATPKSVKDALASAKNDSAEKVANLKNELLESGLKPTYAGLEPMFVSSDDIEVVKNSEDETFSFKHKSVMDEGASITSGDTTFLNGGTIMLPKFTYDKYGHIVEAGTESISITPFEGQGGITFDGNIAKHTNEIAAGNTISNTAGKLAYDGTFKIPEIVYDANGHITGVSYKEISLPSEVTYSLSKDGKKIILTDSKNGTSFVEIDEYVHPASGITAGTYRSVTFDANGHAVAGTNPTTLAGYGITDAASKSHTHGDADIIAISSSKLQGVIPIELIPKAALERLHTVANDTARFALTTDTVQTGDSVKVQSGADGRAHMYYVIDDSKLNSEAGYEEYSAGAASSVPWAGVTGAPNFAASSSQGGAATKAIGDKNGVDITSYLKSVTVSGSTVTFVTGNGTETEITVKDTVYVHPTFTSKSSGIYKITVNAEGHVTAATAVTKNDLVALGLPSTNTTYGNAGTTAGLVVSGGVATISDGVITSISTAAKATNDSKGQAITGYIRGLSISGRTITITKGDGTTSTITTQDTTYTHPTHTAYASGLYKLTVDEKGHVTAAIAVTKNDITSLGIPGTNTTYSAAGDSLGLVKSGGDVTISEGVITVKDDSHNHTISNIDNLQTELNKKAIISTISNKDLDTVTTCGFYNSGGGNTCTNKPTGVDHFGMVVTHNASGSYYTQILMGSDGKQWRRTCTNGTWSDWSDDKLTDTTYSAAGAGLGLIKSGGVATISGGQITAISAATKATNDSKGQAITGYIRKLEVSGKTVTITYGDGTTSTITTQDTNTTYRNMTAATANAAGKSGLVPAPAAGAQGKFLRGDGTWQTPTNTTYNEATESAAGLQSAADKKKLNNIDPYATALPFIKGTQTAVTGSWTGATSEITSLYDGLTIRYYLPYNGSGNATLNLTLADGTTTGAKNIYKSGTSRVTTHYAAGNVIILTYMANASISGSTTKYTGWWVNGDFNSDTYNRLRFQQAIKADTTAIVATNIIVASSSGLYKHLNAGTAFDITYPILYANSAIAASATGTDNYIMREFAVAKTQSITLTAYKPVYIKGQLSGNTFTPVSTTPLTQTIPTSADGYEYMYLGYAYSTTAIYLLPNHPIYVYRNGVFGELGTVGNNEVFIQADAPANPAAGNTIMWYKVLSTES